MLVPVHKCGASGTAAKFSVEVVAHAIVDDDRVDLLDYFWTLMGGYVVRNDGCTDPKKKRAIRMHHMVIGKPPKGLHTSHLNANKLDNRRENLKHCSRSENLVNVLDGPRKYRGQSRGLPRNVYPSPVKGKFVTWVRFERRRYHGGTFDTVEEAVAARDVVRGRLGIH